MEYYRKIVSPILDRLDSETMHVAAKKALNLAERTSATESLLGRLNFQGERFSDPRLNVDIAGIHFDNPIMVGAGWDKTGEAVKGLYDLGFSGVEVGSVLAYEQPGNEKPRQFMVGSGVALNRLGFNSPGAFVVSDNLTRFEHKGIPVGISIGKNKEVLDLYAPPAHASVVRTLYGHASYFAINVSSPNTPGLRRLQDKEPLTDIVQSCLSTMDSIGGRKPVFVKIAPDLELSAIDDVIQVCLDNNLTGIIATNTTINDGIKVRYGKSGEIGGISGNDPDFRNMSTRIIAHVYREAGDRLKIIGAGGVNSYGTAWEKIAAGASLVQVVTGIREVGPTIAGRINRGLVFMMEMISKSEIHDEVFKNITDVVGYQARRYT